MQYIAAACVGEQLITRSLLALIYQLSAVLGCSSFIPGGTVAEQDALSCHPGTQQEQQIASSPSHHHQCRQEDPRPPQTSVPQSGNLGGLESRIRMSVLTVCLRWC